MKYSSRIDEGRTLNPGLLRHQIIWQRKEATPGNEQNTFGEDQFEWVDVLVCRAQIRPMKGRELEAAQQLWAEAQFALLQYYSRGLDTTYRIAWFDDGTWRYFDPLDITALIGTPRMQEITAKERKEEAITT